jgi:hypothetical protein
VPIAVALAIASRATAAPVASPADRFPAQLAGKWDMVGTVSGKAVHHRGDGRWVLNGAGGTLLLEPQEQDGHRATFASYRMTRVP